MIGGGDNGQWPNKRRQRTIDGAHTDRGRRRRMMRPGRDYVGQQELGTSVNNGQWRDKKQSG